MYLTKAELFVGCGCSSESFHHLHCRVMHGFLRICQTLKSIENYDLTRLDQNRHAGHVLIYIHALLM